MSYSGFVLLPEDLCLHFVLIAEFLPSNTGIKVVLHEPITTNTFSAVLDVTPSMPFQDATLFALNTAFSGDYVMLSLVAGRIYLKFNLGGGSSLDLGTCIVTRECNHGIDVQPWH